MHQWPAGGEQPPAHDHAAMLGQWKDGSEANADGRHCLSLSCRCPVAVL